MFWGIVMTTKDIKRWVLEQNKEAVEMIKKKRGSDPQNDFMMGHLYGQRAFSNALINFINGKENPWEGA